MRNVLRRTAKLPYKLQLFGFISDLKRIVTANLRHQDLKFKAAALQLAAIHRQIKVPRRHHLKLLVLFRSGSNF